MSIRSYFMAKFYDSSMKEIERLCFSSWRSELLSSVRGDVLEIGSGTGVNLMHYSKSINSLILTEPDNHMLKLLNETIKQKQADKTRVANTRAENFAADNLAFPDNSFDSVVSTLVLCSVDSPAATLSEIKRVLKPDGKLYFLEHVIAADKPHLIKWQRFFQPFWKHMCGNCHLTRDTESSITNAGFSFERIDRPYSTGGPPIVSPTIKGIARLY